MRNSISTASMRADVSPFRFDEHFSFFCRSGTNERRPGDTNSLGHLSENVSTSKVREEAAGMSSPYSDENARTIGST